MVSNVEYLRLFHSRDDIGNGDFSRLDSIADEYESLEASVAEMEKDAARLDSLEDIICGSRTGVTIERVRCAEDGYVVESGFRAMKFHAATELKSTTREAIDELLSREA